MSPPPGSMALARLTMSENAITAQRTITNLRRRDTETPCRKSFSIERKPHQKPETRETPNKCTVRYWENTTCRHVSYRLKAGMRSSSGSRISRRNTFAGYVPHVVVLDGRFPLCNSSYEVDAAISCLFDKSLPWRLAFA